MAYAWREISQNSRNYSEKFQRISKTWRTGKPENTKLSNTIPKYSKLFQSLALWTHNPKVGGSNPPPQPHVNLSAVGIHSAFSFPKNVNKIRSAWRWNGGKGWKSASSLDLPNLANPLNTCIYGTFHIFVGGSTLGQKPKCAYDIKSLEQISPKACYSECLQRFCLAPIAILAYGTLSCSPPYQRINRLVNRNMT